MNYNKTGFEEIAIATTVTVADTADTAMPISYETSSRARSSRHCPYFEWQ